MTLGAIVAIGLILTVAATGIDVADTDVAVTEWAAEQGSDGSVDLLQAVTWFGDTSTVVALALVVVAVVFRRWSDLVGVGLLVLTVGGQSVLVDVIKRAVDRERPELNQLSGFAGSSFPSGHAAAAAAGFTCFVLLLGRERPRPVRLLLAGLAGGATTSVAATRVLLGVHWSVTSSPASSSVGPGLRCALSPSPAGSDRQTTTTGGARGPSAGDPSRPSLRSTWDSTATADRP